MCQLGSRPAAHSWQLPCMLQLHATSRCTPTRYPVHLHHSPRSSSCARKRPQSMQPHPHSHSKETRTMQPRQLNQGLPCLALSLVCTSTLLQRRSDMYIGAAWCTARPGLGFVDKHGFCIEAKNNRCIRAHSCANFIWCMIRLTGTPTLTQHRKGSQLPQPQCGSTVRSTSTCAVLRTKALAGTARHLCWRHAA